MDNYLQLIERISKSAGLTPEEIERKVEAKRAKLSGLVSKEGAAQIVAAELGINFDKERLKISQIVEGMKRANILGKIISVSPVRSFNKNGREGKVVNLTVADDSSNTKVVLWDTNHISLIEKGELKVGDVVEVTNGNVRNREVHLSSFSDIKKSAEKLGTVVEEAVFNSKKLKDAKAGDNLKVRALIVQLFEPRFFEVCPECGKRVVDGICVNHDKVVAKKRALLNIVLDDGTETMRCVLFAEQIYKLGFTEEEVFSIEKFNEKKDSLLGEERVFSGSVRANTLYNTTELTINGVEEINPDLLLKELENKVL